MFLCAKIANSYEFLARALLGCRWSNFTLKLGRLSFLKRSTKTLNKAILCGQELLTQWAFTCSKLTIETLGQGVKYVQT